MPVEGARSFAASGGDYDAFSGRYSGALAVEFLDFVALADGATVLDVGCGPGALSAELVGREEVTRVLACDPAPSFVEACSARLPDVDVRPGSAEDIPFGEHSCDAALSQLVLHFVSDPATMMDELRRVVRPGGAVAACVWGAGEGMGMLHAFWSAACRVDPAAPEETSSLRFGRPGEIARLFADAGCAEVRETTLRTSSTYADFEEFWRGFLLGVGPAGSYLVGLPEAQRAAVRAALEAELGHPVGSFTVQADAPAAAARLSGTVGK